ncbi:hypothetical protein [Streptomyces goshikiensis]|uniref:hypothetical protein n=1 Tax=Streptomyces goshikiensis TaxID=1942 RepID=UPI0033BA9D88
MSTMRRPLGTGPTTTKTTPPEDAQPRRLPAERVEPDVCGPATDNNRSVAGPQLQGRRILGLGVLPREVVDG